MRAVIRKKVFGSEVVISDAVFDIPEGKCTAIIGPSGSGKTTLLNRVLDEATAQGKKVGVIINEWGQASVDSVIVHARDVEIEELNNGQVFCSCLSSDFIKVLALYAKRDLDAVVVETSGIIAAAPYIFFDVLFAVLTFVPMALTTRNQDSAQRSSSLMMGGVMSIMMLWFGWASCPAAVLLYYVTSSIWQVIQQQVITKGVMEKAKAEAEAEAASKPIEVDVVRREKKPRPHKKS